MKIDYQNIEHLKTLSTAITKTVDKAIEDANEEGYRRHLGASVIGNECMRYLFYHFRWMHRERYDARMLRLFNVGHGLETRVRHWLTEIGFEFIDNTGNGEQTKFSDLQGHFGGSVDGIFIAPKWGIDKPTLLECKTSGTGSPFNDLDKLGMRKAKEQHFIQNSVYGKGLNLENVLYVCENKNDSDWYFELLPLDLTVAENAYKKAAFVIFEAKEPPRRISEKRNFFKCNMCKCQPICFDNVPCDVNCRSCKNSEPVENGQWYCSMYSSIILPDAILAGCSQHEPIQ